MTIPPRVLFDFTQLGKGKIIPIQLEKLPRIPEKTPQHFYFGIILQRHQNEFSNNVY
jgi:hypothetical protein